MVNSEDSDESTIKYLKDLLKRALEAITENIFPTDTKYKTLITAIKEEVYNEESRQFDPDKVVACLCGEYPHLIWNERDRGLHPSIWEARYTCRNGHVLTAPWVDNGLGSYKGDPNVIKLARKEWFIFIVEKFS